MSATAVPIDNVQRLIDEKHAAIARHAACKAHLRQCQAVISMLLAERDAQAHEFARLRLAAVEALALNGVHAAPPPAATVRAAWPHRRASDHHTGAR